MTQGSSAQAVEWEWETETGEWYAVTGGAEFGPEIHSFAQKKQAIEAINNVLEKYANGTTAEDGTLRADYSHPPRSGIGRCHWAAELTPMSSVPN